MPYGVYIENLKEQLLSSDVTSSWVNATQLHEIIDEIGANLDQDIESLDIDASFIFQTEAELSSHTNRCVDILKDWAISGKRPSLTALCAFTLKKMHVTDEESINMLLTASVLGEIPNDLAYHNNTHYAKVLLQMMRMIAVYNDIYMGTSRVLTDQHICYLLAAACIHDLGHDGKGNTIKGVYIPHRLEQNSYDIALQVFKAIGFDNDMGLESMRVMLLCTDVTPFADPTSAVNQAKAAYRYHYLGEGKKIDALNLDDDLTLLETCPVTAAMVMMMHEADIATSAALDYEVTKYETGLLMQEISDGVAKPSHVLDFLNDICNRQMLSEVGQRLYAGNLARIYALTEEDFNLGDEPYPELEHSTFLNRVQATVEGSKSVN